MRVDRAGRCLLWSSGSGEGYIVTCDTGVTFGLRDLVLTVQVSPVPEPSTWAMLAAGFGLPAVTARPRRKA
ncbi:PEP-CTERM sorting domain-containing protein [Massilia buxea]|uniref:PEP-CTERM sorting domain-containing protein n=1 Tax=Pseudoduganella buxea TaxID=1949069 RepID=A0A6I3SWZ9_9BURK|nr:PEP-CTERM sorting domain-containing protein [Pseudoduganella buxea]